MADYLKKIGSKDNIIACRLGQLNKETKYVLDSFGVDPPLLINNLSSADEVILVDHNDPEQTLQPENANVIGLIDHHALTGLATPTPLKIIANQVGCTCTIIYELFRKNDVSLSNQTAGILLSAIISDTLLLKSESTTTEDIEAFNYLTELTNINSTKYGYEMLFAGTETSDMTEYDIITIDSKAYVVNGYPIQIANINTVNYTEILSRKQKIIEAIDDYIIKNKKDLFVLSLKHIIDMDSIILVRGELSYVVEEAFGVELKDNEAFLKGITSRKSQIYPAIENAIDDLETKDEEESYDNYQKNNSEIIIGNIILILAIYLVLL